MNRMKKINVPVCDSCHTGIDPQPIDCLNWKEYSYKPEVLFRISTDYKTIFLRYDVKEKYIRAQASKDNGPVWLDSCVEFFISPEGNDEYYNFEFNCIGTKLLGYRQLGNPTEHAAPDIMKHIQAWSSLGNEPFEEKTGDFSWHLMVEIPIKSLWKHPITDLKGKVMKANFYKCGDELSEPHYLSWNPIDTKKPSFHQPRYFGELAF